MGEDGSLTDKILRLNSMENQAAFKQKLSIDGIPQRLENISAMVHAGARRKSEEEDRKHREIVAAIREGGSLERPNTESSQAFVAMWFDDSMTDAYIDGIKLLEEDTGFEMLRIDGKAFNDKICDRIMAEIRRSRFLIADVTGQRVAVYFEAGFAAGLGIPIMWTCRKDEEKMVKESFDTRQYQHIFWKTPADLREQLKNRILRMIGAYKGKDSG